ncbi:peptide MFS transporter [Bacteroides sp. 224]|uniref:peptide MFS transporter n=1 Tax=Bacteroides sp. 224 TaxID=2302936 RepID=UPI0013CF9CD7|nr:peptide MFS transporter [Bacteroides sp. 224]NDV65999.1 MFS transporter [Bacteroides sp. 224]
MFKNHPKGLLGAALSNMGERFGFYIMMAILVLFLQAKFGFDGTRAGLIYSVFYALIYLLALVGGLIADKTKNFRGTILTGLILMAVGYGLIAIPSPTPVKEFALYLTLTCVGLFVIAFGNGLFKGNLQALVGKMYDDEKYSKMRDSGFSLFYMFINVGAIFAPLLAVLIRNWWLKTNGFVYNADMPSLCHGQLAGTLNAETTEQLRLFADQFGRTDLTAFANEYLDVFTTGFHYAFACAIVAMAISLVVFLLNKKNFPADEKGKVAQTNASATPVTEMDIKEIKQRMYALFAVFGVVIFFWFSFHQNGLTLTSFAKEYTDLSAVKVDLNFTTIEGAEVFQSINPLCVVLLTPLVMGLFGWLRARGKEPSTPRKIAIGMGIAALAYCVMAYGSYIADLPLWSSLFEKVKTDSGDTIVNTIRVLPQEMRVTPFLLIGTYIILTIAELFISPLGISFVSKVAPPQYQGIMQGCWLGATAVGNQLLFIGAIFYQSIPIWMTWCIFVVACLISMFTMIAMVKWLERVAK